jgi:hypothetical protein
MILRNNDNQIWVLKVICRNKPQLNNYAKAVISYGFLFPWLKPTAMKSKWVTFMAVCFS